MNRRCRNVRVDEIVYYLRSFIYHLLTPLRMIFYAPGRLIGKSRRFAALSLPARVAILLSIFLVLCTISAYVAFLLSSESAHWSTWFEFKRIMVLLGLLVAIPVVAYLAVRFWLEGEVAQFPDIEKAWKEGLAELERNGLDINGIPLFLILGAENERSADALLDASTQEFIVTSVPEGRAPLRWYGNEDAIFLVCTNVGCLSLVHRLARSAAPSAPASPEAGVRGTLAQPSVRGTMMAAGDEPSSAVRGTQVSSETAPPSSPSPSYRGTMVAGARETFTPSPSQQEAPAPSRVATGLSRRELEEQTERLRYVCRLLRRTRQPLCPLNGAMVVVPWKEVLAPAGGQELPDAMRRDMETSREATALCFPVTLMVSGMEQEPGFAELVRRVGMERAKANRFGRGFDHWSPPTAENLDALSSHACGAFEDWVYDLFRQPDGLAKPGNSKLYMLLCKIRSRVLERLKTVLINGLASDAGPRHEEERPQLFGGCYFAATGESEEGQSFVKSVFEKMLQLEEELEWTEQAVREDYRCHLFANTLVIVNGVLLIALFGVLVYALRY